MRRLLCIFLLASAALAQSFTLDGQATYKGGVHSLGSRISVSPSSLSFGNQTVSTSSVAKSVTVTNTGFDWLAITSEGVGSNYSQTNTCGSLIAPNGTCTVSVTFTPTATGSLPGTLTIFSNAPVGNPQTVALSGTGTSAGTPNVTLAPTSLTFPDTIVGNSSAAENIVLTNNGTATLNISSIGISGDFGQANNCGSSVLAGANCTIQVTFSPSATGARTGTVTITSNAPTSPDTAGLSGNGITQPPPSSAENAYCALGDVQSFGGFDGPAALPQSCVYTGLDGSPSGTHTNGSAGVVYRVCGDGVSSGFGCAFYNADIQSALNVVQCGDQIELIAGQTYTAPSVAWQFLSDTCDSSHWHYLRSTNISTAGAGLNGFPNEHVQATPCFINRSSVPGYPNYPCASPADLMPHLHSSSGSNPMFVTQQRGASHWRIMGIDFSNPGLGGSLSALQFFALGTSNTGLGRVDTGSDHFIFDRDLFHGPDYGYQSAQVGDSTQKAITTQNSTNIALINSWAYEIYLFLRAGNTVTQTDAQTIAGSGGFFPEGTIKVYGNLLAASGENTMWGGNGNYTYGQAYGPTQNAKDLEIRNNMLIKPWTWMVPWGAPKTQPTLLYPCAKNSQEWKNAQRVLDEGNTFENSWLGQSDETGPGPVFDPRNQNLTVQPAPTVDVNGATVTSSTFVFTTDNFQDWYWDTPIPCNGCGITPAGHWGAPRKQRLIKLALTGGSKVFVVQSVSNPSPSNPAGCDNVAGNVDATGYPIQPTVPHPACRFGTMTLATSTGVTQTGVTATVCHSGQSPDAQTSDITYRYNDLHSVIFGPNPIVNPSSNCADDTYTFFGNYSIHDNVQIGLSGLLSNAMSPTGGWNTSTNAFNIKLANDEASPITWLTNALVQHNTGSIVLGSINNAGFSGGVTSDQMQKSPAPDANGAYMANISWKDNILPGPHEWTYASGSATQSAVNGLNQQSCSDHGVGAGISNPVPGPNCTWTFADNVQGIGLFSHQFLPSPYPLTNCDTTGTNCPASQTGTGCGSGATCFPNSTTYQALFNRYNGGYWFNGQTGLYADLSLNVTNAAAYINSATDGKNVGADFVKKATVQGSSYLTTTFAPISITTTSLPAGSNTVAYSQQLAATGGAGGHFQLWTVTVGSLPPGLTLRLDGLISGTPTTVGTYNFTVQAQDVVNQTASQALSIVINEDMVTWMLITNRTTQYMSGTNSQSSWKDADLQKFWAIKCGTGCTRGYPWDIRLYDSTNSSSDRIYWWVTDNSFTLDPSAYKRFLTPVPLVPRYYTPSAPFDTGEILGPNTIGIDAGGGGCTETTTNLGHIHGVTTGPTNTVWTITGVGTVTLPTMEVDYFWGGTNGNSVYNTRERYFFAKPYGILQWDTASWNGTGYTVNQTSTFTTLNTGTGSATPQFTCSTQSWWVGGQPGVGGNVIP